MFKHLTPAQLATAVKEKVIGQDRAVDELSSYVFSYILYHYGKHAGLNLSSKFNALLLGASGCGKTHLVRTMAEELGFNFIEINAKGISQEGWEGSSFPRLILNGLNDTKVKDVDDTIQNHK